MEYRAKRTAELMATQSGGTGVEAEAIKSVNERFYASEATAADAEVDQTDPDALNNFLELLEQEEGVDDVLAAWANFRDSATYGTADPEDQRLVRVQTYERLQTIDPDLQPGMRIATIELFLDIGDRLQIENAHKVLVRARDYQKAPDAEKVRIGQLIAAARGLT